MPLPLPDPLREQLAGLTAALDDPGTDLQAVLAVLVDDLTAAVPSFLGLVITVHLDGQPVTLTAVDPDRAAAARTSLLIPLDLLGGAGHGSTVVFYAGTPGAFVDLAADTRYAFGLDGEVHLDRHLPGTDHPPIPPPPGIDGLAAATVINQAIGVLIGQGHTPHQAHTELRRRAAHHGRSLLHAAHQLLHDTLGDNPLTAHP